MHRIAFQDPLVTERGSIELARLMLLDGTLQELLKVVRHRGILHKPLHLPKRAGHPADRAQNAPHMLTASGSN